MTTPEAGAVLAGLAELVEALKGPDREVDDAIATALFSDKHRGCIEGLSDEAGGMWMFRYPNGAIGSSLRFTGSLDAAMTLHSGWFHLFHFDDGCRARAIVGFGDEDPSGKASARSVALALTAASLRARASMEVDHG